MRPGNPASESTILFSALIVKLRSLEVDSAAVQQTAVIALGMIGHRPDVISAMTARGMRIGVIATTEVTSDMPEYRNIYELYPGVDWDSRARGLGATLVIPLSSVGEENVLCLPGDPYGMQSIMVHEFAHTIHLLGMRFVDDDFQFRLLTAYADAMAAGLWNNTYAATDEREYFATAAQAYFDAARGNGPPGGDGVYNHIATREQLAVYDPTIYAIVDEVFAGASPLGLCN